MNVVIGVLTYKREIELQACLRSIEASIAHAQAIRPIDVDVVVADNDAAAHSGKTYVERCTRLSTGHNSVPGARQFLLAEARAGKYDYLIFVDDDEVVSTAWLHEMLNVAEEFDCVAVTGPVLPQGLSPSDVPLHMRRRHKTGTQLRSAGAGNLLLKLQLIDGLDFDISWPLPGGEDTDFTSRLTERAGPIVWCDEGEVHEPVTAARRSRRWLMQRYFLNGRILHLCNVSSDKTRPFIQDIVLRSCAIGLSALRLIVSPASASSFRFFLDHGMRNCGYIYQGLTAKR